MVTIYILECEQDKYYVGKIATNVWKRIKTHFDGKGAKWTKKYKPIDIVDIRRGLTERDESKLTLDMMKIYGIHNVRGGAYVKLRLDKAQVEYAEYHIGLRKERPQNRMFDKEQDSRFRKVRLPLDTPPLDTCLAMKKKGKGRCRNKSSNDAQLCSVHNKSAKRWRTISIEEIDLVIPVKATKKKDSKSTLTRELWPEENEPGAAERVSKKNAGKIRLFGQCRGTINSGRRCRLPCERGENTCLAHTCQRRSL